MSDPTTAEVAADPSPTGGASEGVPSRRSIGRWVALGVWLSVIVAWGLHLRSTGTSPTESLQSLIDRLDDAWWAIPAYLVVYAVRPMVLFPASILTIAGGILFGPVVGTGSAVVGANLSAFVAYSLGRVFSPNVVVEDEGAVQDVTSGDGSEAVPASFIARWSGRMRERSFATVMVMRLAYLPYDLVNYAAGVLRIKALPFLAATAIGSLPGTVSFVLAGASVDRLDAGLDGFDPKIFGFSVVLFVISLGVAKLLQRREATT